MEKEAKKRTVLDVSNKELINFSRMDSTNLLEELRTDLRRGLTTEYAEDLQDEYGYNEVGSDSENEWYISLLESLFNPFNIVLMVLATISLVTGDATAGTTIIFLVIASSFIKFIQESKSNKASERLKSMIRTTATTLRDGRRKEIDISELVRGDIVFLSAGDIVPADLRIIESKDLFISQSSLTGESEPIEKFSRLSQKTLDDMPKSPIDLEDLCFMGTNIVSGTATAVVLFIGNNTYFGSMSKLITRKKAKTNFDKGLSDISVFLIKFVVIMVILVFIINGYTKHDWLNAFLFAISVAVGLTPEMLPVIVSANLAKGAVSMSKKRTVVKENRVVALFCRNVRRRN